MYSLQKLLDSQDAVLGPAVPGRDPLLDALNSFVGTPGSPALRPWELGLPNQSDPAGQLAGTGHSVAHLSVNMLTTPASCASVISCTQQDCVANRSQELNLANASSTITASSF